MQVNEIPRYDLDDRPTGCCPRFDPEPWDEQDIHFDHKPFVRASTSSFFHLPLNIGRVFGRTETAIHEADADHGGFLVLSHDDSRFHCEHLFAVSHDVPGAEMVHLSGDFLTKVFDGPYSEIPRWCEELESMVLDRGEFLKRIWFFYTTCPRCAKTYGHNYVVGFAELG